MKVLDKDKIVYQGRHIEVLERKFLNKQNQEQTWEMVHRRIYGQIVVIAAVTPEHELILEKIYRIPLKDYVLELPAGITDVKGEDELETAKRELVEETGYTSTQWELLTEAPVDPGLSENVFLIYLAKNAFQNQEPNHSDTEQIEIIKVPLQDLTKFVEKQRLETKIDIKILSILPLLANRI